MEVHPLLRLLIDLFLIIGIGYFFVKFFRWNRQKILQSTGLIPLWILSLFFTVYLFVSLFSLAISSLGWTMIFVLTFALPILGGLWIISLVVVGVLLLKGYRRASVSAHSFYAVLAVQLVAILLSTGDGGDFELQGSPVFIERILGINFLGEMLSGEVLFIVALITKISYVVFLTVFITKTLRSSVRPQEGAQERVSEAKK